MEPGQAEHLEYILERMSVGVVILDSADFRVRYANPYLCSLLEEQWHAQDLRGRVATELLPAKLHPIVLPLLREVVQSGKCLRYDEAPYEGFLTTRGRTYWRVSIEHTPASSGSSKRELFITIEDVTETVRSRLHLNAIHSISSVIAGPSSLHIVLDRILQALQEMIGASRCAIFLREFPLSALDAHVREYEELFPGSRNLFSTVTMAAQRGVHPTSQDWHPPLDASILLKDLVREPRTVVIPDTSVTPDLEFPQLDNKGVPCRPGSVLCVPIFEPRSVAESPAGLEARGENGLPRSRAVLGTIEVYHRRTRGFPTEEVELLERFAQQAGLAIQNARLFRGIDRWARTAGRQARQQENIMQAIPDGVVIYDPRWRVADANSTARKLFGWAEDVIGMSMLDALLVSPAFFQPDFLAEPDPIAELERRALDGQVDEVKMVSAQGLALTLRCTYTPIRDDLGDTFAFIIIYHDVTDEVAARERIEAEVVVRTTELKQRNEALQQAKAVQELTHARLALLLDRLPSGVILVSAKNSAITIINRQAVQLLQGLGAPLEPYNDPDLACQRAIGISCDALLRALPTYDIAGMPVPYEERPLYSALVEGQSCEAELQLLREDGQPVFLLVNSAPLRAPTGQVTSAVLLFQEITRIKTLERAREDFFTTMAHELKTPLANIRAHLSALLARDLQWSREEQFAYLQTADEQVERIVGMINHFLDASRVEAGALRLDREPVIIPELFEDVQDRLAALITSSRRTLCVSALESLPAVLGDYELLVNVLTNLLSNAFRYAPEGDSVLLSAEPVFRGDEADPGGTQEVGTKADVPVGVRLRVTDRGPGISLEQQTVLFTRFSTFAALRRPVLDPPGQLALERARKTERWSPASGLGLYISRGIVEAHGSELTLTSSPGQGATFAFVLPVFQGKPEQSNSPDGMSIAARDEDSFLEESIKTHGND
jgi:PAS domain S-box-containing protein